MQMRKCQLLIDKTVLKDRKKRHTNLSMAWTDYRKAYELAPHSWVNENAFAKEYATVEAIVEGRWCRSGRYYCEKGESLGRQSIDIVVCVEKC